MMKVWLQNLQNALLVEKQDLSLSALIQNAIIEVCDASQRDREGPRHDSRQHVRKCLIGQTRRMYGNFRQTKVEADKDLHTLGTMSIAIPHAQSEYNLEIP